MAVAPTAQHRAAEALRAAILAVAARDAERVIALQDAHRERALTRLLIALAA